MNTETKEKLYNNGSWKPLFHLIFIFVGPVISLLLIESFVESSKVLGTMFFILAGLFWCISRIIELKDLIKNIENKH